MLRHAPDFSLPDQNGVTRSLNDYAGRWVVLYFYPYDKSLNCTKEACRFRDEYRIISQFGDAEIIGVNKATTESHKHFADKHRLNFPILSDAGHKITSAYGAWRTKGAPLYDKVFGTRRNTYIINPEGQIAKSYIGVNPNTHAEQVINDLQKLQSQKSERKSSAKT